LNIFVHGAFFRGLTATLQQTHSFKSTLALDRLEQDFFAVFFFSYRPGLLVVHPVTDTPQHPDVLDSIALAFRFPKHRRQHRQIQNEVRLEVHPNPVFATTFRNSNFGFALNFSFRRSLLKN
jgi:hypothetical protein